MEIYKTCRTGDLLLIYYREKDVFDFTLIPSCMENRIAKRRTCIFDTLAAGNICRELKFVFPTMVPESMVQFKLSGSPSADGHSNGTSMRNAQCVNELKFLSQEQRGCHIITRFEHGNGLFFDHVVKLEETGVKIHVEVRNETGKTVKFEYLSSFSLGMLSPFHPDDGSGQYFIHRMHSNWSAEGRHERISVECAGLEMSWQSAGLRGLRYGQRSTAPVKNFFPFAGFEDAGAGVLWGVKLDAPGAWELEFSRFCDMLNISGGQPEREFNGWTCQLKDHETYQTMPATVTAVKGDILDLFNRLLLNQVRAPRCEAERTLPPLFNEFCTTWGRPSQENLTRHVKALKGLGLKYFVLDAGWYCKDDEHGQQGDWVLDESKFSGSFDRFLDMIRAEGLIPGIWFEMETVLVNSHVAHDRPDYLLTLDGLPVQVGNRLFLDLRKEGPRQYLREKVIGFLRKHKIGYVKIDYNASFATGCDGLDSPQENQRQYTLAVRSFYDEIRAALPELVIEVCASGGHRLSPGWIDFADMLSFSDAHECPEIPIIALDVQMLVPMAKSQIWAVLRKNDGSKRLHYSLATTLLGRMCLSGCPADLTAGEMEIVKEGVEFHKAASPLLLSGSFRLNHEIGDCRSNPAGWQIFERSNSSLTCITIHTFGDPPERITVKLPEGKELIRQFVSDSLRWTIRGDELEITAPESFEGAAFLFGHSSRAHR